ncbi:MAG TPA: hypothetical protein VF149_03975 [Bacillales bacterium]
MNKKDEDRLDKASSEDLWEPEGLDPDDLFGLNDKEEIIMFQCVDCGGMDPVPEFVVGEFSFELEEGEEVEVECPKCNGTMRRAKEKAEDS